MEGRFELGEAVRVYELRRDREYVERLQLASVEKSEFALETGHGLFGSQGWWAAVEDGSIPTHNVEGTIVDVCVNAADWPEFEVDSDGTSTSWALEGDIRLYSIGNGVRVDYVMQRYLNPPEKGEDSAKIVLSIAVET